MSSPRFFTALSTALVLVVAQTAFAAPGAAANNLQQQQLQDSLQLSEQQSLGRPGSMSPADAQQLNELQLTQRMQQQQLQQQQQQQLQLQRIDPTLGQRNVFQPQVSAERQLQMQQFAADRQLQMQQFDTQQRQLMNTIKPQPLQPQPNAGYLQP